MNCFGDSIYIVSIGSGITMTMTECNDMSRQGGRDASQSRLNRQRVNGSKMEVCESTERIKRTHEMDADIEGGEEELCCDKDSQKDTSIG